MGKATTEAMDTCYDEAVKIRKELNGEDKKNGGSSDTRKDDRIKMENKLVRLVTDHR